MDTNSPADQLTTDSQAEGVGGGHHSWCDRDRCDMDTGGNYVAHRSRDVMLKTYGGFLRCQLYATSLYAAGTPPTVLIGNDIAVGLLSLEDFVATLTLEVNRA